MAIDVTGLPAERGAGTREAAGHPTVYAHRFTGGRLYAWLAVAALAIAALSLLIPSTPSYDPWAWLVWGREIVHLDLHTTGGPSWKPLPVIFTTIFAPFGRATPDLWLVIGRAGAVAAVAMTFKLAWRIAHALGEPGETAFPALLAGVIAAGSLVVSAGFISDNALGYSEGLMTALVLMAIDRHIDGERRQAFAFGFAAALDRPEIWVFWGLYGLWLFWHDPAARKLVVALFAAIPVLWFLPELWGSGHLFRGVSRAQHVRSNSAANAACPFCSELIHHAWNKVLLRVKVVVALALLGAAAALWRARHALWAATRAAFLPGTPAANGASAHPGRPRAELALLVTGGLGIAWWVLIALMTQAGFSGNDRYLVLGAALIVIAGGVGWGWVALLLGRAVAGLARRRVATGAAAGTVTAAVVFMALPPWIGANVVDIPATHRALVYQARLREGVTAAVQRAGGAATVLRCGSVMTEGFQVPMLAWTLHVHTIRVEASPLAGQPLGPPPNTIFQARAQRHATLLPTAAQIGAWTRTGARYSLIAQTRTFRVYSTCRPSR